MVEFAVGSIIILIVLAGALDFGFLFSARLELDNAARSGARWASRHPTAWTNNANPADNSIEGQIIYAGDTTNIVNNDSQIMIQYLIWDKVADTFTQCGVYHANTVPTGFVASGGYTLNTCVKPGTFIKVTVTEIYPSAMLFFQGILPMSGVTVKSQATMLEEI